MDRYRFGRRPDYGSAGGRRRRWIVLLIVVLIVLSVMFGGFQKGTQYKGLGPGGLGPGGLAQPVVVTALASG
jgi:hypothetical protein